MRILLVEDDESMRMGLIDVLHAEHYTVRAAPDGPSGLEMAVGAPFDLILLDVMLPGMDGLALCKELRRRGIRTPVLMLTARAWVHQRVEGLDAGADDYLVKPFDRAELLARIRALSRRRSVESGAATRLRIGAVTVDFHRQTAVRDGVDLGLSAREMKILETLAAAGGRPLTREEILDRAWPPGAAPTNRTIDNHVAAIRARIEQDPTHPQYLLTVHRVGYRLAAGNSSQLHDNSADPTG
jgi:DNA-binding response OmpR family regulator